MDLSGKVAIVTGGSRGIGAAIVELFSSCNAKVYFTYNKSQDAANELAKKTGATCLNCPQSDSEKISQTVDEIFKNEGKIDILINNAGITKDGFLMLMSDADFAQVLDANLSGAFRWTRCVSRKMAAKKSGSIIFMSSVSGLAGVVGQANYAASKGALCALTKTAALEFAAKNIRVNAICPGFIETDMTAKIPRDLAQKQMSKIPLKRFGKAAEVADLAAFLASDSASYITGQFFVIDGGLTCGA